MITHFSFSLLFYKSIKELILLYFKLFLVIFSCYLVYFHSLYIASKQNKKTGKSVSVDTVFTCSKYIKHYIIYTYIVSKKKNFSYISSPVISYYTYILLHKKREVTLSFLNSCFIYSFSDFLIIILLLTLS